MNHDHICQDLSPDAIVTVLEDNAIDSIRSWSSWSELELHEEPELLWTLTDLPVPIFNCVVRPRLTTDSVEAAIHASRDRARSRGVPLSWWLGPAPTPADIETQLEGAGFAKVDEWVGMAVDLNGLAFPPTSPAGLTIEEITDGEQFRRWCLLLGTVFEFGRRGLNAWRRCYEAVGYGPDAPWRHFIALQGTTPVATASLFLGAGVASIANVGTAAELRGRGLGRIVSAHPLALARAAGYRIGTLWASKMGAPMYRRLGFRPFCLGPVYLWKPDL
jgi:GNAT superfamily N-acetyltransferase